MRYAIFSDIHANIEAFERALADIDRRGADKLVFLGDIVGYGPNPSEALDLLIDRADVILGGNHDWATVEKTSSDYFNSYAKSALEWTQRELNEKQMAFLASTEPVGIVDEKFQIAHSSPFQPDQWRYVLGEYYEASVNYDHIERDLCFIGHSHQPLIFRYHSKTKIELIPPCAIQIEEGFKYIVNVGSVGQPRDGNVNACWVLLDTDLGRIDFHRVAYDLELTRRKILKSGLPGYLGDRLTIGR